MRASLFINPLVAVLVGFGSTLAIIVAAAQAVGATPGQVASSVAAVCLATAFISGVLSTANRMPIIAAWSTPGAALIAATDGSISFPEAVGCYVAVAVLILLTAFVKPLTRLIEKLPAAVAAGMLSGVLIKFVIAVFDQATLDPMLVVPLVLLFLVLRVISPAWAVVAILVLGIGLVFGLGKAGPLPDRIGLSTLEFVAPHFTIGSLIGLAIPLYLVTMASQNLPGFAVLKAAGYTPAMRPVLAVTGVASLATGLFGAVTTNLAAITAAICTGPDTHPDATKRWQSGPVYAVSYIVLAAIGASLVALFAALPASLIATIAGLALLAPLVGAVGVALQDDTTRVAAVLTLCVTASDLSVFGVGSAFWGLCAGLLVLGLAKVAASLRKAS